MKFITVIECVRDKWSYRINACISALTFMLNKTDFCEHVDQNANELGIQSCVPDCNPLFEKLWVDAEIYALWKDPKQIGTSYTTVND